MTVFPSFSDKQTRSGFVKTLFFPLFFVSFCPLALLLLFQEQAFSQVVNDPATSMIMVNQSGFRRPIDEKTEELPQSKQPLPVVPLSVPVTSSQTEEGVLETEADGGEPSESTGMVVDKPVQARAVMVDINSKTLNYDKDHDVYVATGSVHMLISEQNSELFTDKLTYDQNQNIAIAEGNVVIVKNGQKTHGSYAKIDLTRKSALINDYRTSVSQVRLTAKEAVVNEKYVQYENGSILISPALLQGMGGPFGKSEKATSKKPLSGRLVQRNEYHDEDISAVAATQRDMEREQSATGESAPAKKSMFSFKMKEMDIHRYKGGFNRVVSRWPSVYAGKHKVLTLPSVEFSLDEPSGDVQYLGPDIGYDADYGGFYFGPGWDFRAGEHGSIRLSPLISYGGGGRRSRGGARFQDRGVGAGIGGVVHYRDPKTFIDAGYNSRVGQPVLLADRKLLDGKTHLRLSANEDYINGFLGYERPGYGAMVYDYRNLAKIGQFRLDSNSSVGWFKDEFFPTYERDFFVDQTSITPSQAGRAQLQARLINDEPLLKVGNVMDFGLRADMILSGYTTGDAAGLLRGGPTMQIHLGDRYNGKIQYYYAGFAGETPFVFDSYYRGRQNIVFGNSFKVNPYLTLGLRSNMSLQRDNARNDLFTGNSLYMLVGPKEVKMSLAYDVIRKRSYFGLNFYPGSGTRNVDFEKMRIFQPQNYNQPTLP